MTDALAQALAILVDVPRPTPIIEPVLQRVTSPVFIGRATEARGRRRPVEEAAAVTAGTERLATLRAFTDERSERTDLSPRRAAPSGRSPRQRRRA